MEKLAYVNTINFTGKHKRLAKPFKIEWIWKVPRTVSDLPDSPILRTTIVNTCCIECGKDAICQQYKAFIPEFTDSST